MARKKAAPIPSRPVPRRASAGDVYAIRVNGGQLALVHVLTDPVDDKVELATVDTLLEKLPSPSDLAGLRLVRKTFGSWDGKIDRCFVDAVVPWFATFVAKIDVIERPDTECNAWGGWYAGSAFLQWRWRQIWSDEDRRPRAGIDRSMMPIDLGAGPTDVRKDTWRMWLGEKGGLVPVPERGVRWDELAKLSLTEISYRGSDPAFLAYVRSQKILGEVSWLSHGQREIDLRDTYILSLTVDAGDAPLRVVVPRYATALRLRGKVANIEVVARDASYPLEISLEGPELPKAMIRGLGAIEALSVWAARRIDLRRLACYPELLSLTIRGAPGSITNVDAFASLPKLRAIDLHELYDLDAHAFPEALADLESVHVRGLEKSQKPVLVEKLGHVRDVEITSVKSAGWIATNLGNPFRGWEEDDARMGKAACDAWRKACAAADKAGGAASKKAAEEILRGLVDALNKIDAKTSLDTIRREESFVAFMELAARFSRVPEKDAEKWFDAWRNF